jgi:hypothetical protein
MTMFLWRGKAIVHLMCDGEWHIINVAHAGLHTEPIIASSLTFIDYSMMAKEDKSLIGWSTHEYA